MNKYYHKKLGLEKENHIKLFIKDWFVIKKF